MEHKFRKSDNGIDLQALLDFCKKEGKIMAVRVNSWSARVILHVGSVSWLGNFFSPSFFHLFDIRSALEMHRK